MQRFMPKKLRIFVLLLLPFAGFALLCGAAWLYARYLLPWMPNCLLRSLTGLLCPSCGLTHALFALCQGDLLGAIRYNALIVLGVAAALGYYAELWLQTIGKPNLFLSRKLWAWLLILGLYLVYWILRNL